MSDDTNDWRARLKEKRKAEQKERRKKFAADPRIVAMKEALKERRRAAYEQAKARRKQFADELKERDAERARAERDARAAELRTHVTPASPPVRGARLEQLRRARSASWRASNFAATMMRATKTIIWSCTATPRRAYFSGSSAPRRRRGCAPL
jgi:hypothetical protein